MLPGARKLGLNNINIDPKQLARIEAIILSMTKQNVVILILLKPAVSKELLKVVALQ